jgi:hypothetical protein
MIKDDFNRNSSSRSKNIKMKRSLITLLLPFYCLMLCFAACKKDTANTYNKIPVADAGFDTIVDATTTTVLLDGTASYDVDGSIVAYNWEQLSGPNKATFSNAGGASNVASNLIPGIYQFNLRVTDNRGANTRAEKKVMVGREFIFEDLVWELGYVDDFDIYAISLNSSTRPDLFGTPDQYSSALKPFPANVYVRFDTASNWLYVPPFYSNNPNSDFVYHTGDSRVIIKSIKNPQVLAGRRASIKVEF